MGRVNEADRDADIASDFWSDFWKAVQYVAEQLVGWLSIPVIRF